jgi:SAM-dependent methyltransferase
MHEIEYHLGELAIAQNPADPRRVMPALPRHVTAVLDLGCGVGQTLMSADLAPDTFACGVDIDAESLAFGARLSSGRFPFVCASGEHLPFADRSFDAVLSRVSLPYMHIPTALGEIARILRPGGSAWFTLHPFFMVREQLIDALRAGNLRSLVFQTYALLNGLALHASGRLFRFPLGRRRCESFQTVGGMTRALRRAGFDQVQTTCDRLFVVTAVRRPVQPPAVPAATSSHVGSTL